MSALLKSTCAEDSKLVFNLKYCSVILSILKDLYVSLDTVKETEKMIE